VISVNESLLSNVFKNKDKENMLIGLECLGLLTILDKEVFHNYSKVFLDILDKGESPEDIIDEDDTTDKMYNIKEKIICLKSTVDGLIVHGLNAEVTQSLFNCITGDYMRISNRFLR